jgi:hypothetical protein
MYLLFESAPFLGWMVSTDIFIYALAVGIFLSFVGYWFVQNVIGDLVRKLLKNSVGEENAKTLSSLGSDNGFYKFLLREGKTLRNIVCVRGGSLTSVNAEKEGEEAPKKKGFKARFASLKRVKYDYTNAEFYIPEDKVEKAKSKFAHRSNPFWLLLVFVLCAVVGFAMTFLVPIIMDLIMK